MLKHRNSGKFRHKHSASNWNMHKSYVGGKSEAVAAASRTFRFFHHSENDDVDVRVLTTMA